jgi:hypothetical protein
MREFIEWTRKSEKTPFYIEAPESILDISKNVQKSKVHRRPAKNLANFPFVTIMLSFSFFYEICCEHIFL